jgi:hypothetical protein
MHRCKMSSFARCHNHTSRCPELPEAPLLVERSASSARAIRPMCPAAHASNVSVGTLDPAYIQSPEHGFHIADYNLCRGSPRRCGETVVGAGAARQGFPAIQIAAPSTGGHGIHAVTGAMKNVLGRRPRSFIKYTYFQHACPTCYGA